MFLSLSIKSQTNHNVIARRLCDEAIRNSKKVSATLSIADLLLLSLQIATEFIAVYCSRVKFIAMTLSLILLFPLVMSAQTSASDLYGAGVRAFYAGDYQTAIQKYSEALALKPNTIGYLYSRGLTYQKLYNDSLATRDFLAVTRLDPKYLDAWYGLGMVQMDRKDYDSAQGYFSHTLVLSPRDVRSLHQLGLISYYKHKYFDAIGFFDKIIELSPDDELAYFQRGLTKFSDEDFEGAAKDFSETYRLNPENTLALEQRALSYLRNNDLDNACRDWNTLLKKGSTRVRENIFLYCGKN